ncbi:unnamed protein product [Owenia fusiformis]|uniref:Uncharacterized protein n=1 Tax=Owenia fusiformis TaxID=6347 RepID=A0A8S4PA02_OWEFU|nr:unnamed protein product [Owenia fusiformis]
MMSLFVRLQTIFILSVFRIQVTTQRRSLTDMLCASNRCSGDREFSENLCRLDVTVRCPRFNNGEFSHWAGNTNKCDKMPEVHKCCFSILQNDTSTIIGVACFDECTKLDIDLRERSRCIRGGHLASVGPTRVSKICDDGRKGRECDPFKFLHRRCCEIVAEDGEANVMCTRRCQKLKAIQ